MLFWSMCGRYIPMRGPQPQRRRPPPGWALEFALLSFCALAKAVAGKGQEGLRCFQSDMGRPTTELGGCAGYRGFSAPSPH
jgi:hypothetical protein